jgi:hypothetical protein
LNELKLVVNTSTNNLLTEFMKLFPLFPTHRCVLPLRVPLPSLLSVGVRTHQPALHPRTQHIQVSPIAHRTTAHLVRTHRRCCGHPRLDAVAIPHWLTPRWCDLRGKSWNDHGIGMQSVRLCFKMLLQNVLLASDADWLPTRLASRFVKKNAIQRQGSKSVCTG